MSSNNNDNYMSGFTARVLNFRQSYSTKSGFESVEKSLLERTRNLVSSIPVDQQECGLSLSELQVRLKGRKGKTCHPGELAECLRKLGFKRERQWRDSCDGFQARWYPKF